MVVGEGAVARVGEPIADGIVAEGEAIARIEPIGRRGVGQRLCRAAGALQAIAIGIEGIGLAAILGVLGVPVLSA